MRQPVLPFEEYTNPDQLWWDAIMAQMMRAFLSEWGWEYWSVKHHFQEDNDT